MNNINWKEEADLINAYADSRIKRTKKEVLEYLEMIISINGKEYLYQNERILLRKLKKRDALK